MSVLLTPDANALMAESQNSCSCLPRRDWMLNRSLCLLQKLLSSSHSHLWKEIRQYSLQLLPYCSKRAVQPQPASIYSSLGQKYSILSPLDNPHTEVHIGQGSIRKFVTDSLHLLDFKTPHLLLGNIKPEHTSYFSCTNLLRRILNKESDFFVFKAMNAKLTFATLAAKFLDRSTYLKNKKQKITASVCLSVRI